MKYFILILFMLAFVSAVDIDFDCPDEIFSDEEFECSLEVFNGDGVYDVKVEVDSERDSVLKIWDSDEDEWLSGYYYLREFIENGEEWDVRLKISEAGDYDGVVKLRQGDNREFFEVELEILRGEETEVVIKDDVNMVKEVAVAKKVGTISLNGVSVDSSDVVYVSKEAKAMDYLPYGFAIFLIFIIVALIWDRGF